MSLLLRIDPAIACTLHAALALLLLWAAAHKLRDVAAFAASLAAYELAPRALVRPAALSLIGLEVAAGVGLLVPPVAPLAALLAGGLLALYTAAIAVNLARGRRHIDCGCLGAAARRPIGVGLVARNGVLIAAALASALPPAARSLAGLDILTIGAGVVALALLYAAADGLIGNASRLVRIRFDAETHQVRHA